MALMCVRAQSSQTYRCAPSSTEQSHVAGGAPGSRMVPQRAHVTWPPTGVSG